MKRDKYYLQIMVLFVSVLNVWKIYQLCNLNVFEVIKNRYF